MYETDYNDYKTMTLFNFFPKNKILKYEFTSNHKENYLNSKNNNDNDINDYTNKKKLKKDRSQTNIKINKRNKLIPSTPRFPVNNNTNKYISPQSRINLYKTSTNFFKDKKIKINKNKNGIKNKDNNDKNNFYIKKETSLENLKTQKSNKNLISEQYYFNYKNKLKYSFNDIKLINQENITKKNNYITDENNAKTCRIYKMNNLKNSKKSIMKFNQKENNYNYNKKYYNNQLPLLNKMNTRKQIILRGISNTVLNSEKSNKKKLLFKNNNYLENNSNKENKENKENNILNENNNNLINYDYNYRINKINQIFSAYNTNSNNINNKKIIKNVNKKNNEKVNKQMNSTNSDFGNNNIIFSQSNSKLGIVNQNKKNSFLNNSNNNYLIKTINSTNNLAWKFSKNKNKEFNENEKETNNEEKNTKNINIFANFTNTNFFMDNKKRLSVNNCNQVKYSSNAKKGFKKLENSLNKNENNIYSVSGKFNTIINSTIMPINKKNKLEKYNIGKVLGKGAYATVKLIINRLTNEKFAMKIYEKSKLNDRLKKKCVYKEIEILKRVNHKNIAKLYEVIYTDTQILIIQEFVKGISLRDYYNKEIRNQKGISEHKANIFKKIFKQIFEAMNYLHCNSMAHRDIKLENILMTKDYGIKIIDFGFGMLNPDNKIQYFFCGTPNYMPPEIVEKKGYIGQRADLWSLGILIYKIYCADFPFKGRNEKDLYKNIRRCEYFIINYVPDNVKIVIRALIEYDPNKRTTCKEVLKSEWLRN